MELEVVSHTAHSPYVDDADDKSRFHKHHQTKQRSITTTLASVKYLFAILAISLMPVALFWVDRRSQVKFQLLQESFSNLEQRLVEEATKNEKKAEEEMEKKNNDVLSTLREISEGHAKVATNFQKLHERVNVMERKWNEFFTSSTEGTSSKKGNVEGEREREEEKNAARGGSTSLQSMIKEIKDLKGDLSFFSNNLEKKYSALEKQVTEVKDHQQQMSYLNVKAKLDQMEASVVELKNAIGIFPRAAVAKPPPVNNPQPYLPPPAGAVIEGGGGGGRITFAEANQELSIFDPYLSITDPVEKNKKRANDVKREFLFSWEAYKKFAWGHDELKPQTASYQDWGGRKSKGLALTIIDSLDMLYILDLKGEFEKAVEYVIHEVDFNQDIRVSCFESTIRIVGGLLSAYELSGEKNARLLEKAVNVMNKLLVAFNTSTGIPHQTLDLKTHQHWSPDWSSGASVLSEFGSVQLEMRTLSYHTKDPIYDMKATHLMSILEAKCPPDMLCPTTMDINNAVFRDDHVTLGALGDSFYEYLLKQYLLTGKTEEKYAKMATTALDSISSRMLRYSVPSRQAYLAELVDGQLDHKMDELACFAGGMYALASKELKDSGLQKTFLHVAESLTETCHQFYTKQRTGLAPEIVEFRNNGQDFSNGADYYLLRPETLESMMYLYHITKKEKYRDWAWDIFLHIREHCRVPSGGYAGLKSINILPVEQDNQMQSFWLAETLKYLYLTFSDNTGDENDDEGKEGKSSSSSIRFSEWVLNTEGHPLKIRQRDPLDIWRQWEQSHPGEGMPWYPPDVKGVTEVETENMKRDRLKDVDSGPRIAPIDPLSREEPPPEEEAEDLPHLISEPQLAQARRQQQLQQSSLQNPALENQKGRDQKSEGRVEALNADARQNSRKSEYEKYVDSQQHQDI